MNNIVEIFNNYNPENIFNYYTKVKYYIVLNMNNLDSISIKILSHFYFWEYLISNYPINNLEDLNTLKTFIKELYTIYSKCYNNKFSSNLKPIDKRTNKEINYKDIKDENGECTDINNIIKEILTISSSFSEKENIEATSGAVVKILEEIKNEKENDNIKLGHIKKVAKKLQGWFPSLKKTLFYFSVLAFIGINTYINIRDFKVNDTSINISIPVVINNIEDIKAQIYKSLEYGNLEDSINKLHPVQNIVEGVINYQSEKLRVYHEIMSSENDEYDADIYDSTLNSINGLYNKIKKVVICHNDLENFNESINNLKSFLLRNKNNDFIKQLLSEYNTVIIFEKKISIFNEDFISNTENYDNPNVNLQNLINDYINNNLYENNNYNIKKINKYIYETAEDIITIGDNKYVPQLINNNFSRKQLDIYYGIINGLNYDSKTNYFTYIYDTQKWKWNKVFTNTQHNMYYTIDNISNSADEDIRINVYNLLNKIRVEIQYNIKISNEKNLRERKNLIDFKFMELSTYNIIFSEKLINFVRENLKKFKDLQEICYSYYFLDLDSVRKDAIHKINDLYDLIPKIAEGRYVNEINNKLNDLKKYLLEHKKDVFIKRLISEYDLDKSKQKKNLEKGMNHKKNEGESIVVLKKLIDDYMDDALRENTSYFIDPIFPTRNI